VKKQSSSGERQSIVITAPDVTVSVFPIVGTADLVSNRFSAEVARMMTEDMAANTTKAEKRARRGARDFAKEAQASVYRSPAGWYGMPANALKSALVRAGSLCGIEMTVLKQCLFVQADGVDAQEGHVQLVRVQCSPDTFQVPTRTKGVVNIASRGRYPAGWRMDLRIEHEPSLISVQSVANLIARAGRSVGIGAGRPMSSTSVGVGWGTFTHAQEAGAAVAAE
jgi:hypothetical protein